MPDGLADGWTLAALVGDGALYGALTASGQWPLAAWLRRSVTAYILLNAGHILSIGLLVGSIVLLDLRLLGRFKRYPLAVLGPPLAAMAMLGAILAIATGLALFIVNPTAYLANPAFTAKLAIVACGLANALALRLSRPWRSALAGGEIAPTLRLAAGLSLILWPAAVLAGRWIGFL